MLKLIRGLWLKLTGEKEVERIRRLLKEHDEFIRDFHAMMASETEYLRRSPEVKASKKAPHLRVVK